MIHTSTQKQPDESQGEDLGDWPGSLGSRRLCDLVGDGLDLGRLTRSELALELFVFEADFAFCRLLVRRSM